jgi:hypothetical protein
MGHHSEHTDLDTPSHPLNTQNIQTLTPRKRSHSLNAQNSLDTQMKMLVSSTCSKLLNFRKSYRLSNSRNSYRLLNSRRRHRLLNTSTH